MNPEMVCASEGDTPTRPTTHSTDQNHGTRVLSQFMTDQADRYDADPDNIHGSEGNRLKATTPSTVRRVPTMSTVNTAMTASMAVMATMCSTAGPTTTP